MSNNARNTIAYLILWVVSLLMSKDKKNTKTQRDWTFSGMLIRAIAGTIFSLPILTATLVFLNYLYTIEHLISEIWVWLGPLILAGFYTFNFIIKEIALYRFGKEYFEKKE